MESRDWGALCEHMTEEVRRRWNCVFRGVDAMESQGGVYDSPTRKFALRAVARCNLFCRCGSLLSHCRPPSPSETQLNQFEIARGGIKPRLQGDIISPSGRSHKAGAPKPMMTSLAFAPLLFRQRPRPPALKTGLPPALTTTHHPRIIPRFFLHLFSSHTRFTFTHTMYALATRNALRRAAVAPVARTAAVAQRFSSTMHDNDPDVRVLCLAQFGSDAEQRQCCRFWRRRSTVT